MSGIAQRPVSDDDGKLRWFGESWGAPLNEECVQVPTPVGETCWDLACRRPIADGDRGLSMVYVAVEGAPMRRVYSHLLCFGRLIGCRALAKPGVSTPDPQEGG